MSQMINIKVAPRRMLNSREASDYLGIKGKRLPVAPIAMPDGAKLYDIRDLDAWLDNLKAGSVDSDDDIIGRLS